jgi:MoaA/NifB/PqqE/SkfB family radical SAM enzyme
MKPCPRVGVELSWRCNWDCETCFYHFDERLHKAIDNNWNDIQKVIDEGHKNGCTHTVAVGYGEPMMSPTWRQMIEYCKSIGMTSSIITNGSMDVELYQEAMALGLDHLHISTHGVGKVLDLISNRRDQHEKQLKVLEWLKENNLPWRSNITLQKQNYEQMLEVAKQNVKYGVRHFVLLGFLPHYHWTDPDKMKQVAVHPKDLQPYIEETIDYLESNDVLITLRYHPLCFLDKKYWKYVTNAWHVAFDPWEWCYNNAFPNGGLKAAYASANILSDIGSKLPACKLCAAYSHCNGYNKFYLEGFGNPQMPIKKIDLEETTPGYFFDQNPANHYNGDFS